MNRRSLLLGLAGLTALSRGAAAMEKPYRVSLVGDAFTGEMWHAGIRIELAPGWKTYWRMPGESGIPPLFGWNGSTGEGWIEVLYPLPGRHADLSGETIGYADEVVFPLRVKPDTGLARNLVLDLFFAVCRDICVPAQARVEAVLGTAVRDLQGNRLVEQWMSKVPVPGEIATAADVVADGDGLSLRLSLAGEADDIFVEAEGSAYFRAPEFSGDGRRARLRIDNVSDVATLRGASLRLTADMAGKGLEQTVTLP